MNNSIEPFAALEHPVANKAERIRGGNRVNIMLPKKIYEALPAAYMFMGALFVLGAVYIGIGHWSTVGYLGVGIACVIAGATVDSIRRRERSRSVTVST